MKTKNKKKKTRVLTTAFIIMLVSGLCIFLYPTVGNLINRVTSRAEISEYEETVEVMESEVIDEKLEAANAFNEIVASFSTGNPTPDADKLLGQYRSQFSVGDLICFMSIPQIDIYLPVYSGEAEEALSKGVWLIDRTSLPVGGESTHAVLSGHRGLPSAKLFTNLDKLENGDMFFIHVLGQTLAYEIDSIKTVLPSEADDIVVTPGEDHVTLVTCTPYGVNTHRLLIRGSRVEYSEEKELSLPHKADTAFIIPDFDVIIAGVFLAALMVTLFFSKGKKKAPGKKKQQESNRYFDNDLGASK